VERLYLRSLEVRMANEGPDHPDVALALRNLGGLYAALSRRDEALKFYEQALENYRRSPGPPASIEHRKGHAKVLLSPAVLHDRDNTIPKVLDYFEQASRLHEETWGTDHPELVDLLLCHGTFRLRIGDTAGAEELLLRALRIGETTLGRDHVVVARILSAYGDLLEQPKHKPESEEASKRAEAILALHASTNPPGHSIDIRDLGTSKRK
jgi:tetratricopeptide (TPR) repeat protein